MENLQSPEPKILIAMPTLGLNPDPDRWLMSLIRILNNVRREGFAHACFFPYKQTWWPANNEIWDTAFIHKFDYILRIDDDIWDVPEDAFSKLLHANVSVIGAAYPSRYFPYKICALKKLEDLDLVQAFKEKKLIVEAVVGYDMRSPDITGKEIVPVDLIGFGMTLIKTSVFRFLPRPIYHGEEVCPDDTYFAQLCIDEGIQQWVHLGVQLKHQHVTFQNAGHLFNADVPVLLNTEKKDENLATSIQL